MNAGEEADEKSGGSALALGTLKTELESTEAEEATLEANEGVGVAVTTTTEKTVTVTTSTAPELDGVGVAEADTTGVAEPLRTLLLLLLLIGKVENNCRFTSSNALLSNSCEI